MAPLTPAQKAVLERIEKKKELLQKKATKRKARAEPEAAPDQPAPAENDLDSVKKRRRVEQKVTKIEVPKKNLKQAKEKPEKQQPQDAAVSPQKTMRRKREPVKSEELCDSSDTQQSPKVTTKAPARRGRKTEIADSQEESLANQTLNEAQLKVLQMLEGKKSTKDKGRKSLKSQKPVTNEETIEIDSESEHAVTSTFSEPVSRGKKKTVDVEAFLEPDTPTRGKVAAPKRGKKAINVVPVEISDAEEDENLTTSVAAPHPESQSEEEEGPLNATMMAVMEKIKEKKSRVPVKKQPAKAKQKAKTVVSPPKKETPLTPNQISVMKKLQEKKDETVYEVSDGEEEKDKQLSTEDVEEVIQKLSVPINNRQRTYVRRLRNEGVYDAIEKGRLLTPVQNALVAKYKVLLEKTPLPVANHQPEEEQIETDATDEIVALTSKRGQQIEETDSEEEESEEERMEIDSSKTHLIFDTNAYLKILPYCRAVLDSEKLRDDGDYVNLTMFALFVVIHELDSISKKKLHLKKPAMAATRLIHDALQKKNPHIEGQDFASSKEKLAGSNLNDDFILNSANLLQKRGTNVIVVTDDKNLQVKITMMRLTSLNCLDFISRFHWLTPLISADVKREVVTIGEDTLTKFTECVVASIILKGVFAHLAPLPMERRREIFPSEKLAIVLALMLKNKKLLEAHSGPFGVLNYDRVAQTLNPLQKFDEIDRVIPKDPMRFQYFARFVASAEILCHTIAGYFPNMESRAELVTNISNYFHMYLPEEERVAIRKQEPVRKVIETPIRSEAPPRFEPAKKSLLPTRKPVSNTVEPTVVNSPPKIQTPRATRSTRGRNVEPQEEATPEPVYFSFSQGRYVEDSFKPVSVPEPPKLYSVTPTKPVAQKVLTSPYSNLQESISEDLSATVYEYFQKFGLSICNYTGSCCVKLGVRFSLAFKVSSARLENSLPEITDSFALVLKAMKKLIAGFSNLEAAREFLLHSSRVMEAIGRADGDLVNGLPKITPDALFAFSKDSEGKQQLVTGYQQFCDFNNCLEKCWLEEQRA